MSSLQRIALLTSTCALVWAQSPRIIGTDPQVIPLWDHDVPGALGNTPVDRPFLTHYPPAPPGIAAGTAIIIAPGGGYQSLALTHAGLRAAKRLSAMGISA